MAAVREILAAWWRDTRLSASILTPLAHPADIEARDAESLELARSEGERSRIELEKITLAGRVGRAYRSGDQASTEHRRDLADQA